MDNNLTDLINAVLEYEGAVEVMRKSQDDSPELNYAIDAAISKKRAMIDLAKKLKAESNG